MSKQSRRFATPLMSFAFSVFLLSVCLLAPARAQTAFTSTDFLIADFTGGRIAVYDQSFTFKGYIDSDFPMVSTLALLPNGNLVAASYMQEVRTYDRSGTRLSSFTSSLMGTPRNMKVSSSGNYFIPAQDSEYGINEFSSNGTYLRSIGAGSDYGSMVLLPNGNLWAGGAGYWNQVDIFNSATGSLTGDFPLDNGQMSTYSMFYSASTGTVLTSCYNDFAVLNLGVPPTVVERNLNGDFVKAFYGPSGIEPYGLTRGPNGDVYVSQVQTYKVHRWNAAGDYLGEIDTTAQVAVPAAIYWAGNTIAPTAASVSISGRVTAGRAPVAGAVVSLTDARGATRSARTNSFGFYKFDGVGAGENYVLSAMAKGHRFDTQFVTASEDVREVNFDASTSAGASGGSRK